MQFIRDSVNGLPSPRHIARSDDKDNASAAAVMNRLTEDVAEEKKEPDGGGRTR